MHLLCKQVDVGALPTDSTISLRGTRLKHRAKSHKLCQAGVIPAPATNICTGSDPARICKPVVTKQCWKMTTGAFELPVPPRFSFPKCCCSLSRTVVQHFPPFLDP